MPRKTSAELTAEAERAYTSAAGQRRRELQAREVEPESRPTSTPAAELALKRAEQAARRDGSTVDPKGGR